MPFQPGNKHGQKSKAFDSALRRAIAQDDGQRLRLAAEALLNAAADGQPWAIDKLADRLDGKPGQSVDVTQTIRKVTEYSEDELIAVAFGSSARGAGQAQSEGEPSEFH